MSGISVSMRFSLTRVCWIIVVSLATIDLVLYVRSLLAGRLAPVPGAGAPTGEDACSPHVPCEYDDEVDLRLIVLTYKRSESLRRLLSSLNDLVVDGDSVSLHIWIDRSQDGSLDAATAAVAAGFPWTLGPYRVHIQRQHVGIYGQWIDTWRPRAASREMALILEDDISVSPYAYRWLKAARRFYGHRPDVMGYTLQSDNVNRAAGGGPLQESSKKTAFMYRLLGSWGFAPRPDVWRDFQDWFHRVREDSAFKPYVPDLTMTKWYKAFELKRTADSMWTMWFIHFTDSRKLFCVYNNLNAFLRNGNRSLAVNRKEPGLHYSGKAVNNTRELLRSWDPAYTVFPKATTMFAFDGSKAFTAKDPAV